MKKVKKKLKDYGYETIRVYPDVHQRINILRAHRKETVTELLRYLLSLGEQELKR